MEFLAKVGGSGSGSVVLGAELPRRARACVWQWHSDSSQMGCTGSRASIRSF
jgi:hypothetical protein